MDRNLEKGEPWSYCGSLKKVQDEGYGAAVDANEEVDTWQRDVGCAGDTEYVGHGVHHGCHRPAEREGSGLASVSTMLESNAIYSIFYILYYPFVIKN